MPTVDKTEKIIRMTFFKCVFVKGLKPGNSAREQFILKVLADKIL